MKLNINELIKQKEKILEIRKLLELKEENGEKVKPKEKKYRIGKNLELIDTKETRIQDKTEEYCSHPILWIVNYNRSNREYYEENKEHTDYWYKCMHCGKVFTNKIKPETDNILTAPSDLNYVSYFREKIFQEFQEEYFNILEELKDEETTIEIINKKLEEKFKKQKIKKL